MIIGLGLSSLDGHFIPWFLYFPLYSGLHVFLVANVTFDSVGSLYLNWQMDIC